jgi:hypothetical protein
MCSEDTKIKLKFLIFQLAVTQTKFKVVVYSFQMLVKCFKCQQTTFKINSSWLFHGSETSKNVISFKSTAKPLS